jgi:EmrB/QacA subfamily drug resistance transporter
MFGFKKAASRAAPPASEAGAKNLATAGQAASAHDDEPPKLWLIFPALMLAVLLAALDQTIVSTALPTIVSELGGLERLSWVVTAYMLASTVVVPIYGKLGDLFGRRVVLQSAIALFLVASALCGMAQTMEQLVALRALQGLGGGGLMVVAMAAVGDVVPPARRGRYQGLFGAVFGVATVVGPLLGGFLVESFSWRWIFYINLPIGLLALFALGVAFKPHAKRVGHQIDYWGAGFLAVGLGAITLFATEGGSTVPWSDASLWMVLALGLICIVGFVREQREAAEPLMPLELFASRTVALACAISFVVGFAMFGAITFVPLYLQIVHGSTPTQAGLQTLPMMAGILVASISSGRWVSHSGKYRRFPIVGTALAAVGLAMLSRVDAHTPLMHLYAGLAVLGVGLGLVMQIMILAAQNDAQAKHLGVATSSVTLFRSIGGSMGVAAFGAIFSNVLRSKVEALVAANPNAAWPANATAKAIDALAPALRSSYLDAFATSLRPVFLIAAVVALVAFALSWWLKEKPLRGHEKKQSSSQEKTEKSVNKKQQPGFATTASIGGGE